MGSNSKIVSRQHEAGLLESGRRRTERKGSFQSKHGLVWGCHSDSPTCTTFIPVTLNAMLPWQREMRSYGCARDQRNFLQSDLMEAFSEDHDLNGIPSHFATVILVLGRCLQCRSCFPSAAGGTASFQELTWVFRKTQTSPNNIGYKGEG